MFSSKAVGEPPFMLTINVFETLHDTTAQARGDGKPVQLTALATAENVLRALI
jgi:xanthine dehydrogenase molybdopterin-binding subunit B